jgi:putative transposase
VLIPRKESNAMKEHTTSTAIPTHALKAEALASMSASFERFCLAAGVEALNEMMEQDAAAVCGERHERGERRKAHRWGRTRGKIGFHGGKVEIERPRVRGLDGKEQVLPSWENAINEDLLGKWAMNQMLINVSTRRFKRSVRLPEGDVPSPEGAGLSKSATSRRFVALSASRMKAWMESRLDALDLLAIQIDGIHMDEDLILVAAIGVDANGDKHPLGLVEGATENATTVQALIDNLVERGLDPSAPRLFIIDGSKALSKAIRRTFGRDAAIQRCQVHKARNILERLPKSMHASVKRVLRQAWELDDADKAEKLIRNLARRLERDWKGVSASILEGLDDMLTVTRLKLPRELRRSLACTNIVENVMSTVRRVCRNVKYWRSASMALRWAAAAMQEASKGFRRLKAHKHLQALRAALVQRNAKAASAAHLVQTAEAA